MLGAYVKSSKAFARDRQAEADFEAAASVTLWFHLFVQLGLGYIDDPEAS
jgi:hypothetical protein